MARARPSPGRNSRVSGRVELGQPAQRKRGPLRGALHGEARCTFAAFTLAEETETRLMPASLSALPPAAPALALSSTSDLSAMPNASELDVGVCVYYCSTYYKAVRVGEAREGDSGGHVLRETTS